MKSLSIENEQQHIEEHQFYMQKEIAVPSERNQNQKEERKSCLDSNYLPRREKTKRWFMMTQMRWFQTQSRNQ